MNHTQRNSLIIKSTDGNHIAQPQDGELPVDRNCGNCEEIYDYYRPKITDFVATVRKIRTGRIIKMDCRPRCKECGKNIPKSRVENSFSKSVVFCSTECGVKHWNKHVRDNLPKRPIKKCINCDKKTNEVRDYCNMKCYHEYAIKQKNNVMINSSDYQALNGSFIGVEEESCVIL